MDLFKSPFWHDPPGHRFQGRYHARRNPDTPSLGRALRIVSGIVLIVVGTAFLVLPGPGIPPLILGAALIAGESLTVARWLDAVELRLRRWRE